MTGTLLRLDRERIAALLRHPRWGSAIGIVVPLALLVGALWVAGLATRPGVPTAASGATLGLLAGGALGFVCYNALLLGGDTGFLRRLGVPPRALYRERALRLLALSLGIAVLLIVPFAAAGESVGPPLAVTLAVALVGWGAALASYSLAALGMAHRKTGQGWGCLTMGMWDREVAGAAPLVYAPLPPLLAAGACGALVGAAAAALPGLLASAAVSLVLAALAEAAYVRALPRFAPQALEMSFAPPPPAGAAELRVGRGAMRLLPRRAAAVGARDAVVASRRFGWATRVVWPVAIVGFFALARWGRLPETRQAVAGAAALVLLLQAAAIVGLGRAERAGRRWVDRAAGITPVQRLLGRWAWGWGMSLWLAVPLALAWSWWAVGPGWPWLVAGAVTAAAAALASTAAAGWR